MSARTVVLPSPPGEERVEYTVFSLPHGRTESLARYLVTKNLPYVLEMQTFGRKGCSSCWFADNYVLSDGRVIVCTKIDPVFLVLPQVLSARKATPENEKGFYCSMPQIMAHEACEEGFRVLSSHVDIEELIAVVCDVTLVEDTKHYRVNERLLMAWLRAKVANLTSYIQSKYNKDTLFLKKHRDKKELSEEQAKETAVEIVTDYIPEEWGTKLKAEYPELKPIKAPSDDAAGPPQTVWRHQQQIIDYEGEEKEPVKTKRKKKTIKAPEGNAKITSFFAAKGK